MRKFQVATDDFLNFFMITIYKKIFVNWCIRSNPAEFIERFLSYFEVKNINSVLVAVTFFFHLKTNRLNKK